MLVEMGISSFLNIEINILRIKLLFIRNNYIYKNYIYKIYIVNGDRPILIFLLLF